MTSKTPKSLDSIPHSSSRFRPAFMTEDAWIAYVDSLPTRFRNTVLRQDVFLAAYAKVGTAKAGCEALGTERYTYDAWLRDDSHHFRSRLRVAQDAHADLLEEMMLARLQDPRGNRGSDILLIFNLKGKRPEVYREVPVILGANIGQEVQAKLIKLMSEEQRRRQAVTVEAAETVEAQVVRVLGPGARPGPRPDTKVGEVLDKP